MKTLIASAALISFALSAPVAARDSFMPWASAHWEVSDAVAPARNVRNSFMPWASAHWEVPDFEARVGAVRVGIRDSAFAPWLFPGEVTIDITKASAGTRGSVAGFSPKG